MAADWPWHPEKWHYLEIKSLAAREMALFRNITARAHQVTELYSARTRPLLPISLDTAILQYENHTLQRGILLASSTLRSSFLGCIVSRENLLCTSRRWLHTQSASCLTDKAEKKPKDTVRPRRGSGEHGSVLNELMSIKAEDQPKQLTVGAKVVQAGRDFTYLLVVVGGFAVAGFLLWSVSSEFFSSNSPQTLYSKALKRVKQDPRVADTLGEPISGHGELRGRGRRREPLHQEYMVEGVSYMRMKFYVKGTKRTGEVHLDLKKNEQGKYELRFLFVELDGHPRGTIVIEDSR